jgi:hypothetical protein
MARGAKDAESMTHDSTHGGGAPTEPDADAYRTRPADHYSLAHEDIAKAGLSDAADIADAPLTGWPAHHRWHDGSGGLILHADLLDDEAGDA